MNVHPLRPRGAIVARLMTPVTAEALGQEAYEFVRMHFRDDGRPYSTATHNHVLERTTAFLMQQADISSNAAALIAGHAICEYVSSQARVSIDIDRSTAFGIVVTDKTNGTSRLVSAFEISQLFAAQAILTAAPTPH